MEEHMRASIAYTMSHSVPAAILGAWIAVGAHAPASANVITDWDEKAVAFLQPRMVPPVAYRAMAIVHIAMFDAVNSIEPLYQPLLCPVPSNGGDVERCRGRSGGGCGADTASSGHLVRNPGSLEKLPFGNPRKRREVERRQAGRRGCGKNARGARQRRIVDCGCPPGPAH